MLAWKPGEAERVYFARVTQALPAQVLFVPPYHQFHFKILVRPMLKCRANPIRNCWVSSSVPWTWMLREWRWDKTFPSVMLCQCFDLVCLAWRTPRTHHHWSQAAVMPTVMYQCVQQFWFHSIAVVLHSIAIVFHLSRGPTPADVGIEQEPVAAGAHEQ